MIGCKVREVESRAMKVTLLTSVESLKDMERFAALAELTRYANTEQDYIPRDVLEDIIAKGDESALEHINLTYHVEEISSVCLQELALYRNISLSAENIGHTLPKNLGNAEWHIKMWKACPSKGRGVLQYLLGVILGYRGKISNEELEYLILRFCPVNLVLTINIRELRHILNSHIEQAELRELVLVLYDSVPEEFKYLLKACVHNEADNDIN